MRSSYRASSAAMGHEVTFLTKTGSWAAAQTLPSDVQRKESSMNFYSPWEWMRLARWVRAEKFDIIHSHNTRASNFGAILGLVTQAKSVATAHHQNWQLHWRLHDHVIAVTEMGRRAHVERSAVRLERSSVVHCFVDCERFNPAPSAIREEFRKQNHLPEKALVFGIVGNVEPRKGHRFLIQALPAIRRKFPQFKLAVIGSNEREYGKEVKGLAQDLGVADSIVWIGTQKEMVPVYKALDALVLSSLDEQLPLVMLEAMASGLPTIATSVGGIPEVICDHQTGLLVPASNVEGLENAIIELAESATLRQSLARNAVEQVQKQFSRTKQTQRVVDVFESLLGSPSGSVTSAGEAVSKSNSPRAAA